jgi:type II secretory pathway pseudopilin PulG
VSTRNGAAFSLIEVLVSIALLSTAIVFIFRAFNTSLSAARLSRNISLTCFVIEQKIWEIEQQRKDNLAIPETASSEINLAGEKFNLDYIIADTDIATLKRLNIKTSWRQRRLKPYSMDFSTLLLLQN